MAMLSDPFALVLVLAGLGLAIGTVAWAAIRGHRTTSTAARLAYVALDGRPEEARVEARQAGAHMKPLLEALSGALVSPRARPWLGDAAVMAVVHVPLVLLSLYGWSQLTAEAADARIGGATAVFQGVAVLWPAAAAASIAVVVLARHTARALRGTCVTLIAKSVRQQVDADLADQLRRGGVPRDPRGE